MKRRLAPVVVAVVVACVAVGAGACDPDCNSIEPAYAGEANDETWRTMLDGRAQAKDSDEVTLAAPDVDADDAIAIGWSSTLQASLTRATLRNPRARASSRPRRRPDLFDRLSAMIIPAAHAHLEPITSDLYFLEVEVPGRTCAVAGLTTDESFTFDDDDRAAILAGGGERTARLMGAFVTDNRITEGPFLAAPVTFSVTE